MIERLPVKLMGQKFKTLQQWNASRSVSGTWIAVSPVESLPEEYKNRIEEGISLRILYEVPESWKLIKLSEEDNNFDLVRKAENDIYSIPGHNIIKEIPSLDGLLWGVASGDLGFHLCYNYELLDKNPWIEKGKWVLFCLGSAHTINERISTKEKYLDYCSKNNITYEELV